MAHSRGDVLKTRNELLRLIGEQRDIYAGAIACLDNTKRMLLMVDAEAVTEVVTDLSDPIPSVDVPVNNAIRGLARKMGG